MKGLVHPAERQLLRAVRALLQQDPMLGQWMAQPLGEAGGRLTLDGLICEPWASLTYQGHRHLLTILLHGPEAEVDEAHRRLLDRLLEPEIVLDGRFLAEFQLGEREGMLDDEGRLSLALSFEALTIDEDDHA